MISSSSAPSPACSSAQPANRSCSSAREPLRHRVVGGVADQDVAEAEAVLAGERARVRLDQPLADERLQAAGDLADLLRRREVGDGAPPEDLADHRRPLQHRQLVLAEPVEARREHGLHRLRARAASRRPRAARAGRRARRGRRPRRASAASPRGRADCRRSRGRPRRRHPDRAARPGSRAACARARAAAARAGSSSRPRPGRSSARSGRARQQTRIGASRLQPARYSTRSRNAGSAHWMSSSTSTTGRSRASVSSRRRIAQ